MPNEGAPEDGEEGPWVPFPPLPSEVTGTIVLIVGFILIADFAAVAGLDHLRPEYNIVMDRHAPGEEEMAVLRTVEAMDLHGITGISRYGTHRFEEVNETPEPPGFVLPRLIDEGSIAFYRGIVVSYLKEGEEVIATVNYTADCRHVGPVNLTYHEDTGWLEMDVDVRWRGMEDYMPQLRFDYHDLSGLEVENGSYTMEGVYLVTQALGFYQYSGPLASISCGTRQMVLLDEDLVPRAVIVEVSSTLRS